jgi:hypothetical protein
LFSLDTITVAAFIVGTLHEVRFQKTELYAGSGGVSLVAVVQSAPALAEKKSRLPTQRRFSTFLELLWSRENWSKIGTVIVRNM